LINNCDDEHSDGPSDSNVIHSRRERRLSDVSKSTLTLLLERYAAVQS